MFPYLAANFSLAVNPNPAITMYIILLYNPASTLSPNHVLPMNAAAHNKNDKNVITLLLLILSLVPSLNILFNQLIIISRKIIRLLTCLYTFASIGPECFLQSQVVENSILQKLLRKSKIMFLTLCFLKLMVVQDQELFFFLMLLLQVRFQSRLSQNRLVLIVLFA
jgi:hypothetical protein